MTTSAAERFALARQSAYSRGMDLRRQLGGDGSTMVRDPSAATARTSYLTPGRAMVPQWDHKQAIRYAYLANVFVYACVRAKAKAVSGCPLVAGARFQDETQLRPESLLQKFLGPPPGGPNPRMMSRRLIAWSIANLCVGGQFAWEIEYAADKRTIAAFWPLVTTPDLFERIPTTTGSSYWAGFKYGIAGQRKTLSAEQVFYVWNPSLDDPREPESELQAARLPISSAVMHSRYQFAFLRNDARPAAVVVHEMFEERGERDAFREQFLATHGGPDNAGKVAFVESEGGEDGVKDSLLIQTLGLSQKDAQSLQLYQRDLQDICVATGVPMSMLDASGRTFDNAGVEQRNFWELTGLPLINDMSDELNLQISPRLGSEVAWFDYSHITALRPQQRFQPTSPVALYEAKIASKAEIRADYGLPAESDPALDEPGDQPDDEGTEMTLKDQVSAVAILVQVGFDRAAALAAVGLPAIKVADNPPAIPPAPPAPVRRPRATRAEDEEARKARAVKVWTSHDSQATALEATWERTFRALFARQERSTLERLRGKRGRQMLADIEVRLATRDDETPLELTQDEIANIFDEGYWRQDTADGSQQLYEAVYAVGGARLADAFGISFDVGSPSALEFIHGRTNKLAGQVTQVTYSAITDALADGVEAGEGIDKLGARIKDVFADATTVRAGTIARTEVVSALNGSADQVASHAPASLIAGKEWIATQDSRTRDAHAEADGQKVPNGRPFRVGGFDMRYPGDPSAPADLIVNCRCTQAYLTPDEMPGLVGNDGDPAGDAYGRQSVDVRRAALILTRIAGKRTTPAEAAAELLELVA